jgi:transketolase
VPLEAIYRFRQLGSPCPGHPEYRWTSGVETTTGPLGQGLANSVGMAIAGRWLAARYHRPGFEDLIDFNVYALCGDGCIMEGISAEAASLAGHLRLSNLCWIYDNNHITIEGNTALAFSDDVATRFIGHGWNVTRVGDANDLEMLERAFTTFRSTSDRPTLIIVDSHIAYGAPNKQDTSAAHGEPLGEEEIRLAKRHYGWPRCQVLMPDGVWTTSAASAAAWDPRDAWRAVKDTPISGLGTVCHRCTGGCRRLGPGPAHIRTRSQGTGDAGRIREGTQRPRQERAVADGRLGGPGPLVQDASHVRRGR